MPPQVAPSHRRTGFKEKLPLVWFITLPPGTDSYFVKRASSLLSWRLRRRICVRARTCDLSIPWQAVSAHYLATWLKVGKGRVLTGYKYTSAESDVNSDPEDPTVYL